MMVTAISFFSLSGVVKERMNRIF